LAAGAVAVTLALQRPKPPSDFRGGAALLLLPHPHPLYAHTPVGHRRTRRAHTTAAEAIVMTCIGTAITPSYTVRVQQTDCVKSCHLYRHTTLASTSAMSQAGANNNPSLTVLVGSCFLSVHTMDATPVSRRCEEAPPNLMREDMQILRKMLNKSHQCFDMPVMRHALAGAPLSSRRVHVCRKRNPKAKPSYALVSNLDSYAMLAEQVTAGKNQSTPHMLGVVSWQ